MVVYIIPETRQIERVTIIKTYDDMAEIESTGVINPDGSNKNKRCVNLVALYTLRNYIF